MPFLDALAAEWLERAGGDPLAVSRGLILLPTRRAARALAEAFLRASGGRPLLLPRITALGALDEAPLTLAGALDLPPAVEPAQRLAALSPTDPGDERCERRAADRGSCLAARRRTRRADGRGGAGGDRPRRAGCRRPPIPAYAAHWAQTLEFLHIVTRAWPDWLAEQGLMNPAARLVALLDAQADAWDASSASGAVWSLRHDGRHSGGGAAAAGGVARLPNGAVVLPGLDTDDVRAGLGGAGRRPSAGWTGSASARAGRDAATTSVHGRQRAPTRGPRHAVRLLSRALLPAAALVEWQKAGPGGDRWPDAACRRPTSRRKPPPSPWCCARRWRPRAPRRRW